ncbi:hypothetical protein [Taibaiella koreensis]|uniref:hypothetical protein n=1 Tax=Taibaiella koreensis TaxID=1268548 RepID=UPI000E59E3BB|nr:hypothetical protein [Taibaiella koreensis]
MVAGIAIKGYGSMQLRNAGSAGTVSQVCCFPSKGLLLMRGLVVPAFSLVNRHRESEYSYRNSLFFALW